MKTKKWDDQLRQGKLVKVLNDFRKSSADAGWQDLCSEAEALLGRYSRSRDAVIRGEQLDSEHHTLANMIDLELRELLQQYHSRLQQQQDSGNWVDEHDPALAAFKLALDVREQRQLEKAISLFSEAISMAPLFAEAYAERGNTHCMLPEPEVAAALKDYNEALRLQPGSPMALVNRGLLYYSQLGDRAKACADWAAAAAGGDPFARQFLDQYCNEAL